MPISLFLTIAGNIILLPRPSLLSDSCLILVWFLSGSCLVLVWFLSGSCVPQKKSPESSPSGDLHDFISRSLSVVLLFLHLQVFPVFIIFHLGFCPGGIDNNLIVLAVAEVIDLIVKEGITGGVSAQFGINYL